MSIVLRPGDRAPELDLENQDEQLVSLAGLRGHPVIVYFFPEAFSPGCTTEVCDFRAANAVNHDLLSDPGCTTARRWGAWGPKTVNGQATTGPLRSTFIVDAEGVLQSAQYHVDAASHVVELRRQVGV